MNLDSLPNSLSYIDCLVNNLTKKNIKASAQEIEELLLYFGNVAEQHLCRVILNQIHWPINPETKSSSKPISNGVAGLCIITAETEEDKTSQLPLSFKNPNGAAILQLINQLTQVIPPDRFAFCLSSAISNPFNREQVVRPYWVNSVCKVLKLSKVQEVLVCLQLVKSPNIDIQTQSVNILKVKLPELVQSYIEAERVGQELQDLTTEILHLISTWCSKDFSLCQFLNQEQIAALVSSIQKEFSRLQSPLVILPVAYTKSDIPKDKLGIEIVDTMTSKTMTDESLAELLSEIGCGFCGSYEECKSNLANYGAGHLTPTSVAYALSYMMKTQTNLQSEQFNLQNLSDQSSLWPDKDRGPRSSRGSFPDINPQSPIGSGPNQQGGWNVEIFVKVIMELSPNFQGKEAITKLDHKGFYVRDRTCLQFFLTIAKLLVPSLVNRSEAFLVDFIMHSWENTEEQLILISQILNNSDLFCFTDFPCTTVITEGLKSVAEMENKEIQNWKCLHLVEVLINLAEAGHFGPVQEVLKFPIQHCPDILLLGLVQASSPFTSLRQDLIKKLLPTFLASHPNSSAVLHLIWNTLKETAMVQQLAILAMADWYMKAENDQTRLSRILDVAQDLKALSSLLNALPFAFVIDLACLAYRREYLKLDKWVPDKIREHGEPFVVACMKFLQVRCPVLVGGKEDPIPKSNQLPQETITTMITALQNCSIGLPQEHLDNLMAMAQNLNSWSRANRARTNMINVFPQASDSMSNLGSSLGNLSLGNASVTSTIYSSSSAPMSMGPIGGEIAPSSPVRLPALAAQGSSSQAGALSSIISNNPFSLTPNAMTQLTTATSVSVTSADSNRSQTSLSQINLNRPMQITEILDMPAMISKEVDDEANSYFQRIYNLPPHPTLTIEDVLEMLRKFQNSSVKREKEVYMCMLKNLFEEYKFFPTYPYRELILTAKLFGGLIEQGFVEFIALGVALRLVMEALQKPPSTKMHHFGVVALDRFKARMKDYPRYCKHLLTIKHFNEFAPHLALYVKYGADSQDPPNHPEGEVLPPALIMQMNNSSAVWEGNMASSNSAKTAVTTTTTNVSISQVNVTSSTNKTSMSTTNIDSLLEATEEDRKYTPPPENLQEKIAFIFNNLSQLNLPQKCKELKDELPEAYWKWLGQYMVMKRASIENNFHNLYSAFLDELNQPRFSKLVMDETLMNVKILLRQDKGTANPSDKGLLKNLGHWLGLLTLAKNKPILHIDIDMKSLLVEAYRNGLQELQFVVPFVAKVMEATEKSLVFKPPNPWTMAILSVLSELHAEQDMKLHLKFEIEVLCNKLNICLRDIKPSVILRNPSKRIKPQLVHQSRRAESTPLIPAYQSNVAYDWPVSQERRSAGKPVGKDMFHTTKLEGASIAQSSSAGATPTPPSLPTVQSVTPTPIQTLTGMSIEPKFTYKEVPLTSSRFFEANIVLAQQLYSVDNGPQMKQIVRHAIEAAVQEISSIVADRSIKVAVQTSEQLVRKDFALEADASKMRASAHNMVRHLTAAHSMMPCKDHLATTIAKGIKQSISQHFNTAVLESEHFERFATGVAQDNVAMACVFIQKCAAEKAIQEIDKRLSADYDRRKLARNEGKQYFDQQVNAFQTERVPEKIRMKMGGPSHLELLVYQEFGRNIPGFAPPAEPDSLDVNPVAVQDANFFLPKPVAVPSSYNSEEPTPMTMITDRIATEVESMIQTYGNVSPSISNLLHGLLEILLLARTNRDNAHDQLVVKKCVENLLEAFREMPSDDLNALFLRFRDVHLLLLKTLAESRLGSLLPKLVARSWLDAREDIRYNMEVINWFIRYQFMHVSFLDEQFVRFLDDMYPLAHLSNQMLFLIKFIQTYLIEDTTVISENDIPQTVERLVKMSHSRQLPEVLMNMVEAIRYRNEVLMSTDRIAPNLNCDVSGIPMSAVRGSGLSSPTSQHFYSGVSQATDMNDPPGLKDKTEMLLRHWIKMYHSANGDHSSTQAFQVIVKEMDVHGILKTDDVITRFFRLAICICRETCMRTLLDSGTSTPTTIRGKCFPYLDAFVRLIALLVKQSGEPGNPTAKINLLNKFLGLITGILCSDIENLNLDFHQLPFHRMLIMLFLELNAPEPVLETINMQVLVAFTQTLHLLRPSACPGFVYAWLEIVSHRVFIGRMLAIVPQQRGWSMYSMLFTDLFKFLAPYLRNVELSKPFTMLYKGTLRVLLVLLHDFPEFLCEFHYTFCDVIPPNCIQMRNLILSAYPPKMRLPDPFMPNLRVERLSEITQCPKIHANIAQLIQPVELKTNLDSYLKNRTPVTFLSDLRTYLQVEPGKYNMQLMNALVLYVGMQAIAHLQHKGLTPSMTTISHSAHMDIFENLSVDLDTEGRYLFLVAIANQLRYPNSHTHYFSCSLLYLFTEATSEAIQEQITRVLLERLIGNRPQPWGLLITFIELLKNRSFKFWEHDFVKCAPEIEKIFDSVARSCMVKNNAEVST